MKKSKILGLLILGLLYGCIQISTHKKEENKFAGLWELYIIEQQDPETKEWKEWRNGLQGYIFYDDKNTMSVHLTTKGYQDTELRFPNFVDSIPDAALKHLTNSYVYFAKYTVDEEERTVEHARISHSNPGEWNAVVKRRFSFSGDTLMLQPLEQENAALRLKWVKSKATN